MTFHSRDYFRIHLTALFVFTLFCSSLAADKKKSKPTPRTIDWKSVTVTFDDPHPYHVYPIGETTTAALVLKNTAETNTSFVLKTELHDLDGPLDVRQKPLSLQGGEILRIAIAPIAEKVIGCGRLYFQLMIDEESSNKAYVSFARMKLAGPPTENPKGMRFGIAYGAGGGRDQEAEAMSMIGVNTVRLNPHWTKVERKQGKFNWDWYDKQVEAHTSRGMALQAIIHGIPHWARIKSNGGKGNIPKPEYWEEWVRAVSTHLKGKARFWEIWNEPDIDFFKGTVDEYLDIQRTAAKVINEVDPNTMVMTGGFASIHHRHYKDEIIKRTLTEAADSFEAVTYHRHGYFERFYNEIDGNLIPLIRKHASKDIPLYFSETAMDTRWGEKHQAITLIKKVVYAWSRGAICYTWFNFDDKYTGKRAEKSGGTYGLFTKDISPKPSYVAYNTVISLLKDAEYLEEWQLPDMQFAFVFKTPENYVVVAWNENEENLSSLPIITQFGGTIKTINTAGRKNILPTADNVALLPLSNDPFFYVFDKKPTFAGCLTANADAPEAAPDLPLETTLTLTNPLKRALSLNLTLTETDKVYLHSPPRKKITIAAGNKADVSWKAELKHSKNIKPGRSVTTSLKIALADSKAIEIPLPVRVNMLRVPQHKSVSFDLDDNTDIINYHENDPHTIHLLWRGKDDLSAKTELSWNNGLQGKIIVTDDKHVTTEKQDLSDSITISLILPNETRTFTAALHNEQTRIASDDWNGTIEAEKTDKGITYSFHLPKSSAPDLEKMSKNGDVRFSLQVNDYEDEDLTSSLRTSGASGLRNHPLLFIEE